MAVKTIKFLLFTWFENVPDHTDPNTDRMLRTERLNWLGETVDITDEASLARGEELGAFFTDEEAAAIESGTFRGPTAEAVYRRRTGTRPAQITDGEEDDTAGSGGVDFYALSGEELGTYIRENELNVAKTKALLPHDADAEDIQKMYEAEDFATENDPRKGVTDYLDARLAAAGEQS